MSNFAKSAHPNVLKCTGLLSNYITVLTAV